MAQQLILNFNLRAPASFENFYTGSALPDNKTSKLEIITGILEQFADNKHRFVYLYGQAATGKTHLLQAIGNQLQPNSTRSYFYLSFKTENLSPQVLDDLNIFDVLCLDDLDSISQNKDWELALFDCYNQRLDAGKQLLIASKDAPSNWGFELADLKSRLSSALILEVPVCGDDDKFEILTEWVNRNFIIIEPKVILFILQNYSRDLGSLFDLFTYLSEMSLREKKKITVPFIKLFLE